MKNLVCYVFLICFFIPCCQVFSQNQTIEKSNEGVIAGEDNTASPDVSSQTEEQVDVEPERAEDISTAADSSESTEQEVLTKDDLDDVSSIDEGPDIEDEIKKEVSSKEIYSISESLLDPSDIEQMQKLQIEVSVKPADVILLKNGESIEGVIRDKTQNIISIETEYGLRVFSKDDIDFLDEISEKERFYLLDKIEALQVFHKKVNEKKLEEKKKELEQQKEKAQQQTESLEKLTNQDATNLFSLTNLRLEEIIKEFSQFPPDYWRYYHRKGDAQKAVLRLRRLERFAHPEILETIKLYLQAFDNKIKELGTSEESLSRETYKDNYKKFFRNAEKRRMVLKDTQFN